MAIQSDLNKILYTILIGIKRPLGPPPPTPSRLSHGRSNESLSSMCSDVEGTNQPNPVPPPRKVSLSFNIFYCKKLLKVEMNLASNSCFQE